MADYRLTRGSPGLVMVEGIIHKIEGHQVWWVDTGGRVMGPARMVWQPTMTHVAGDGGHRHQIEQPPVGTACTVIIPAGDYGRAVVLPLKGRA